VVRGGSFNNNERNARCAYRNRNNPNNRNRNNGFRVVVSTFFDGGLPAGTVVRVRADARVAFANEARKMAELPPGRVSPLGWDRAHSNGPTPWAGNALVWGHPGATYVCPCVHLA
jgi:hypothetical protein